MNRSGAADCRWPPFTYSSEALTMISPVDPVRRFYDAMGCRDVAGGPRGSHRPRAAMLEAEIAQTWMFVRPAPKRPVVFAI